MNNATDLNVSSEEQTAQQMSSSQDLYETISLPENSLLTAQTLADFKQAANEVNLPAQTLGKWIELEEKRLTQLAENQTQKKRAQIRAWAQETQQYWGEHAAHEIASAVRAADYFGGSALRELLEETGLGNHPVIVRTFAEVGKRLQEDVCAVGTPGTSMDKTFMQALYGKK